MAKYEIDSQKKFRKEINKAIKKVGDLTIPFGLMTREWFKANRSIFDKGRVGPGKYADLSPKYKVAKGKKYGFVYPILRGSGKLAESMIEADHPDSIAIITNKNVLTLGTKVTNKKNKPYPIFLHFGTNKMTARPLVLLGGEQVATRPINKRRENWVTMLNDYVLQVSKGFAK